MSEKDKMEQRNIETVLAQAKKTKLLLALAREEVARLRKISQHYVREKSLAVARADSLSRQLNVMLAEYPLDKAPEACVPYTQMVTKCQEKVAELELAVAKGDSAIDTLSLAVDTLAAANRKADSTITDQSQQLEVAKDKLKPKKLLGFIPLPSRFLVFVLGVIGGAVATK